MRKDDSETKISLTLTLDAPDLAKIKKTTLARLAKKLKVAGFRAGKVPSVVAEKNLDANSLNMEVAEDAINHYIVDALRQEKLQPLDQPKIELSKYVPNETLECAAVIDVLPNVKLGDYKNLKAKTTAAKVTDEEVSEIIERLRLNVAKKQEADRPAKTNDEVSIDFDGKDEAGEPVAGASSKDYLLTLGSNSFIPGFEDGLIGKKVGETFDLLLTFPKDYNHKPLAGAKVTFTVTVNKVQEVALPELDDAFAASCGPFKTVDELQSDIKRELTNQKEREALDRLKDQLVEQAVAGSHVPTPEILIADQMAGLERDFEQNLQYRGSTLQQYLEDKNLTKDEWRDKELREQAVRRVKIGLVLAELSKIEKIEPTRAELDKRLGELLQQYGNDSKMRQQLDTPEVHRDIASRLVTEKTIDRLVELNKS